MTPDELREVERFAAEIVEYERTHANPARDDAEDAEWAKLRDQFPGEYVAYLDSWDGNTLTRRVLAHDADIGNIMASAETWTAEEQEHVRTDYIDPPNTFAVGFSLPTAWGRRNCRE